MMGPDLSGEPIEIGRRGFLLGGGVIALVLGTRLGRAVAAETGGADPSAGGRFNAWLAIAGDDTVTLRCGRAEMGQGIFTGLGMCVAEELGCRWDQIRVETGPADSAFKNIFGGKSLLVGEANDPDHPGGLRDWVVTKVARVATEQFTGGSSSMRDGFDSLRLVGASARHLLIAAAAQSWGVAAADCAAADGEVRHGPSGRSARFGALAAAAARLDPPGAVGLKPRAAWRVIGTPMPRIDVPAKVDGTAQFGIDIRRPGMLFAAVANCPIFGGTLTQVDPAPALAMPGVVAVVPVPGGVAVVAGSTWAARQGLAALKITWNGGAFAAETSASLLTHFTTALEGPVKTRYRRGDGAAALTGTGAEGGKPVVAEYRVPWLAHLTMEPMNATAEIGAEGVDVWVPTQVQTRAQKIAAEIAGVGADKVRIHTPYLGGGFGRRGEVDLVAQAVTLAKATGKPVQVLWSREEDVQHDFYRPAAVSRLSARLGPDGRPHVWVQRVVSQSIFARVFPPMTWMNGDPAVIDGAADLPYAIPHQAVESAEIDLAVPVGNWRSVGHSANAFFTECFMDELAAAGGIDPLALRRRLLADEPRSLAVLDRVASASGWGTALPPGVGRGLALHRSFGAIIAEVAEVAVAADQTLTVRRVVAVVDCGTVVNPDSVEAQVQSGILYGLSAALAGKITIDQGRVVEENFGDLPVIRLAQTPAIEVHLIASTLYPAGVGEPATPPIAPAVVNAIFAATGKRVRALPLVDQGFKVGLG